MNAEGYLFFINRTSDEDVDHFLEITPTDCNSVPIPLFYGVHCAVHGSRDLELSRIENA